MRRVGAGFRGRAPLRVDIDSDREFTSLYRRCSEFTMTSPERMYSLYQASKYVVESDISGDVVECGVWRGGSMMLSALTLLLLGDRTRSIYLYDTFAGMSEPTDEDISWLGTRAHPKWAAARRDEVVHWENVPLSEVEANLRLTGFPRERLIFVKGKVEETLPGTIPSQISLLRLDTDWYESTYHELQHLFPLLSPGGVLILDDYGHWEGQRKATHRYLDETGAKLLLNRIDYTGRIAIKPG
ncbi:MAG: TylF/MycF family methyltransferase [Actinobacteria bacterium]|nr:TylF/MycF family methyltransferase [Actinomycetota bacterium]